MATQLPAGPFWLRRPIRTTGKPGALWAYRKGSGRDAFIRKHWADAEEKQMPRQEKQALKEKLTPLQYHVTQEGGTEPPFHNAYWNERRPGIYVDIITGEPLFSSLDKFDPGCGWPSFSKPLQKESLVERVDRSHGMSRRVRARQSGSHLGHVFDDGPPPHRPALSSTGGAALCSARRDGKGATAATGPVPKRGRRNSKGLP